MTLDERIAKRKAEGWGVHYVVKCGSQYFSKDQSGTSGCVIRWCDGLQMAKRYIMHNAHQIEGVVGGRTVPVFHRTIRTKRGHSFSWALARMKEGKTVRRKGRPELLAMRDGWLVEFYENTKVHSLSSCHIKASDWELAE